MLINYRFNNTVDGDTTKSEIVPIITIDIEPTIADMERFVTEELDYNSLEDFVMENAQELVEDYDGGIEDFKRGDYEDAIDIYGELGKELKSFLVRIYEQTITRKIAAYINQLIIDNGILDITD